MFARQCCHCCSVVCRFVVLFVMLTKFYMQTLVTKRLAAKSRNNPDWSGLVMEDSLLLVVHCFDLG
jgi:hypothetical protein